MEKEERAKDMTRHKLEIESEKKNHEETVKALTEQQALVKQLLEMPQCLQQKPNQPLQQNTRKSWRPISNFEQ